jgi:hypothetical protein
MAVEQTKQSIQLYLVGKPSGDTLIVHYITLDGNDPKAYSNKLFLWQGSGSDIPIGHDPSAQSAINLSDPEGELPFEGEFQSKSYIIGYAVGPCAGKTKDRYENVAATLPVPANTGDPALLVARVTTIEVVTANEDVIFCGYSVPGGASPNSDGDWAGVWQTDSPTRLYDMPPISSRQVPGNEENGDVSLVATIQRGYHYTVGYFRGGWDTKTPSQTTLAAATTFLA